MTDEHMVREHYRSLTELLIRKHLTLTTMESATGGQIASLITDTEGSSAVLKGAFITYSNEAKILQGVPEEVIARYTVYSRETAEAMAEACVKAYPSDIGIGITGTMGNVDPANEAASEPGCVYYAILMGGDMHSYMTRIDPQPDRLAYKLMAAEEIYQSLIRRI